jgi:hypothetical protein
MHHRAVVCCAGNLLGCSLHRTIRIEVPPTLGRLVVPSAKEEDQWLLTESRSSGIMAKRSLERQRLAIR